METKNDITSSRESSPVNSLEQERKDALPFERQPDPNTCGICGNPIWGGHVHPDDQLEKLNQHLGLK